MIALSAAEIAAIVGGTVTDAEAANPAAALVTGPVVSDSRDAVPGALFAALPGERVDGGDFAAIAAKAGAVAVVVGRRSNSATGISRRGAIVLSGLSSSE